MCSVQVPMFTNSGRFASTSALLSRVSISPVSIHELKLPTLQSYHEVQSKAECARSVILVQFTFNFHVKFEVKKNCVKIGFQEITGNTGI